jgi:hypothetical protein
MLSRAGILLPASGRIRRLSAFGKTLGAFCGAILADHAARADWRANLSPLLAQESAAEGGYPIIEWAIVVVLIGAAVFVICRSSRRN